ncbi:MAG TPA: transposase family protein [Anaerolineae bacterium]|nr:transposase family protein [Anaerolineae bacterium]
MAGKKGKRSLLEQWRMMPDPRSRHGRIYPRYGMLAVLILAAMHGENSLLGMWPRAKERKERLVNFMPLGLWARPHLPSPGSFWRVAQKRDAGVLEGVVRAWVLSWEGEAAMP